MTAIDKDAILARAKNAVLIAVAEWEAEHRVILTQHEREIFAFAYAAGFTQGVREVYVTTSEGT
jgi:hypothetical protein